MNNFVRLILGMLLAVMIMSLFIQKPQEPTTQPLPAPVEETAKHTNLAEEVGRAHRYGGGVIYKLKDGENTIYFSDKGGVAVTK